MPETNKPWDLSDGKVRAKATQLVQEGMPFCLILSPMRTAFSTIQNINKERRDPQTVKKELEDGKDHVRWVMRLCALQHRANRYFALGHPSTATSWEMAEVKKVAALDRVESVKFDMCQFGMEMFDPETKTMKPVKRRTRILTD